MLTTKQYAVFRYVEECDLWEQLSIGFETLTEAIYYKGLSSSTYKHSKLTIYRVYFTTKEK